MNDAIINNRQKNIVWYLIQNPNKSHEDIVGNLPSIKKYSRITLSRDLGYLTKLGYLEKYGKTKGVYYKVNTKKSLLLPIDDQDYFSLSPDQRNVLYPKFNYNIYDNFPETLFTKEELNVFEKGKKRFTKYINKKNDIYLKKELERFTIELSWKSSQIEGNTYSLLETEELIKNQKKAKGHSLLEAIMILNHKNAFDTILANKNNYKKLTLHDIRSVHSLLVNDMDIPTGIREKAVGVTGTKYNPIDNKWVIEENLDKTISTLYEFRDSPSQALFLLAMISYIQPFVDGNKRTSRMLSNAVLIANDYLPLSYRSVDEVKYKKAVVLFYEQNNLYLLKQIFLEQQRFAMETYFRG